MSAEPRNRVSPTNGDSGGTPSRPPMDGRGVRAADVRGRSVPDLLRELSGEGADLVRQEVELAKAEMSEKLDIFQRNMVSMAIGGAFLLGALLFGLWAVNAGLTALLALVVDVEIAIWLSPLILAIALAAIGWSMIQSGKKAISREGLSPRQSMQSLEEDKRWAKSKAREMKEDIKHG